MDSDRSSQALAFLIRQCDRIVVIASKFLPHACRLARFSAKTSDHSPSRVVYDGEIRDWRIVRAKW